MVKTKFNNCFDMKMRKLNVYWNCQTQHSTLPFPVLSVSCSSPLNFRSRTTLLSVIFFSYSFSPQTTQKSKQSLLHSTKESSNHFKKRRNREATVAEQRSNHTERALSKQIIIITYKRKAK